MDLIEGIKKEIYKEEKTTTQEIFEKIKESLTPESKMSEEEKKIYDKRINEKIKMGKKLTQSEMDYIRRTNPIMYQHVKRVQMQRDILDKKLKNCKSKKEVEEVYNQAIGSISKKDPDKEALISAYQNVTTEFKKTNEYKCLPLKEKDKKEGKEKEQDNLKDQLINTQGWDDIEKNSFDLRI